MFISGLKDVLGANGAGDRENAHQAGTASGERGRREMIRAAAFAIALALAMPAVADARAETFLTLERQFDDLEKIAEQRRFMAPHTRA